MWEQIFTRSTKTEDASEYLSGKTLNRGKDTTMPPLRHSRPGGTHRCDLPTRPNCVVPALQEGISDRHVHAWPVDSGPRLSRTMRPKPGWHENPLLCVQGIVAGPKGRAKEGIYIPEIHEKCGPEGQTTLVMASTWRICQCFVNFGDEKDNPMKDMTWADWHQRGRLVFASNGKIMAASIEPDGLGPQPNWPTSTTTNRSPLKLQNWHSW